MDIKDLVLPDPRLDIMKAWTGGLGQLERFLENSCSRSTDPAPTDMFPVFPSSGSSQAMPGSAPLNPSAAANPWFHQSPFSMAADIHSGTSGPTSSSMTGSPYWLPHHQYPPTPTDPHQSRYSAGNDLYSASASAASPWWFGHSTAASAGSGLHSSQYFPQHVTRNDHMSNPFHTSTTPSKPGYLQHGLATPQHLQQQQQSVPSPAQHLHQSAVQQPTYHSPATSQHEAMSSPAPIQPVPSSQHQSIGISNQHQRSLMSPSSQQLSSPASMMTQLDGMVGGQASRSHQQQQQQQQHQQQHQQHQQHPQQHQQQHQQQQQQQHHQVQRPMVPRPQQQQQPQQSQQKSSYVGMGQHHIPTSTQLMNHQSVLPPMSSSSQMMAPQSQMHNSMASSGLDTNIQPIFELYGHDPLAGVPNSHLLHQQQQRYDMTVNAMSQQATSGFSQPPQQQQQQQLQPQQPQQQPQPQQTWMPPETSTEATAKWPKPEATTPAEGGTENDTKEDAAKPDAAAGSPTKKTKGKRKKEEGAKKKQKQDIPAETKKAGLQRKNIRDIKNETELDEVTLNAQKEEQERMKRLQEARMRALQSQNLSGGPVPPAAVAPIALGSSSSSEDEDSASQSGSEDEAAVPRRAGDVIDISSSDEAKIPEEDDDDVVMVVSDGDDADDEKGDDLNDGAHINDAVNQPDSMGRVLVNVGHPPEDTDVFLAPQLAPIVKPHQIGGIRFLFDNVVESVGRFDTSSGFGCILAHSMGLGKTIQVISFVDILLRHTTARKVLCITPINTIQNWLAEFDKWVPAPEAVLQNLVDSGQIRPRSYHVYLLNDMYRSTTARAELILDWHKKGGVLLMGYEMYRMLALKKVARPSKRRRSPKKEDLSVPEDDSRSSQLLEDIYQAIVNPGPDLVICDEGHRIKNCNASTSTALKSIRTKRRIVLTGYPLQNNLLEYWCMVDFVRPSYLGTRSEFCNMFERPIQNGQCLDSTPKDRQLMRFRAHVLHSLLQGFVQRRGHAVLREALPRKEEHVLLIRMTPIQRTLYREFVKEFLHNYRVTNPLKFFAVCCKVWNHPDILFNLVQDRKSEEGLDIDLDIDMIGPTGKESSSLAKKHHHHHHHHHHHTNAAAGNPDSVVAENSCAGPDGSLGGCVDSLGQSQDSSPYTYAANCDSGSAVVAVGANKSKYIQEQGLMPFREKSENNISYEWAYPLMEKYLPDLLENSHKFLVLMTIVEQTLGIGDKLLVFSQSLSTLDLVERFLSRREVPLRPGLPHGEKWMRGKNYFRLDGSTSAQEREKLINEYNCNQAVSLFLLSTRAGCLGINLTGANRIVVLDASWNPCHDAQAVCRIYRYGQAKPCHIYRLVCDNCLEKRIYDRQVNKQGMSDRVVDEMNPEANLTWKDVSTLVQDNEDDPPVQDLSAVASGFTDSVLRTLTMEYSQCLTKEPFEHESLLLDRKDLKLTKFEKRLAKQSYELEKRATLHGGRTYMHTTTTAGYSNGYQTWQNRQGTVTFLGPGPTQTTPTPMQPGSQNGDMPVWGTPNVMQSLLRQGMTVQRMRVPAKVTIPLNNSSDPPVEIPPGTEILVMKTPKGVYLRIPDGRIIAVRIPTSGEMATAGQSGESASSSTATVSTGNKQSFGIIQPSLQCGGRVQLSGAAARQVSKGPPEVINLDDDSDLPDESSDDEEGGGRKNGAIAPLGTVKNTSSMLEKPKEAGAASKPVAV